jgi:HAE1 family hydrophobic/amphiphilic exporter-1
VVVTFGVLVSLFVSLTLTPMLCSRYLKVEKQHGPSTGPSTACSSGMDSLYVRLLEGALTHRLWVLLAAVIVVASSAFFFINVGKAFSPEQDEGRFLVSVRTPLGSSIDYTDAKLREVEAILDGHPEVRSEFVLIGLGTAGQVNQGTVVVRMAPREERSVKQQDIIAAAAQGICPRLPARGSLPRPTRWSAGASAASLCSSCWPAKTCRNSVATRARCSASWPPSAGIGRIDTDLQLDLPQLVFAPDRLRIADANLSTQDVALAINMLTGGVDLAKYNDEPGDGQRYDIRVKAKEGTFTQPADLSKIFLRNKSGELVRLDSVATFRGSPRPGHRRALRPAVRRHLLCLPDDAAGRGGRDASNDRRRNAAHRLPGQADRPGRGVRQDAEVHEFHLRSGHDPALHGAGQPVQQLPAAAIVMLAQPLAIVGGVAALWLFGQTLNIYSMIGLVLLIGLVAKNSILLVDLTNQRREQGLAVDAALRNACPIRMRPVLMTSMTVILALLPARSASVPATRPTSRWRSPSSAA